MVLRARDVAVSYGDEPVLEGLSVGVEAGDVLAVIGPSGVGKSTLLRLLALAETPDDGTVELDGTDAWALDNGDRLRLRRRIGMVFQEANLFDASVARNVEYGLRVRRLWSDRLRDWAASIVGPSTPTDAVTEALSVVGLADRGDQPAGSLSGGEAQRVSFARALAYDPDVLLLDEPTSDLDPRNTALIEEAVSAARDRGIGVVLATHDMHQAERVADRAAVLLGDGIAEIGPTDRVFEDPNDDRTRQFISGELVY
ncbi:tungstate transport system ATP-binding protein [Halopenitus malekzadehii]|uniref:Tungstate transport system ATP-binding protein n=1 Tax=Halopenitus malekzadehii TaxID=1267564 RepID=A0A1H6JJ41_9EURY|nr:tungstate transport system ATP-binding protein [Halopenitus malekzadehii]